MLILGSVLVASQAALIEKLKQKNQAMKAHRTKMDAQVKHKEEQGSLFDPESSRLTSLAAGSRSRVRQATLCTRSISTSCRSRTASSRPRWKSVRPLRASFCASLGLSGSLCLCRCAGDRQLLRLKHTTGKTVQVLNDTKVSAALLPDFKTYQAIDWAHGR
jgi:hypothetical protein